ncbi:PLD nuclease N-terminal domain-containing protein [Kiloniella antarctica]|uniref:PLD nuclease N-terminal domain-containing protein n=1 Tax=Kiloniella antarctica TaxID=1550907 RepID=A0ABW5BS86_9PROT
MFSLETGSIIGLTLLVMNLWAITKILRSHEAVAVKVLWIATVALIPVFGFTFWVFMGPRKEKIGEEQLNPHL